MIMNKDFKKRMNRKAKSRRDENSSNWISLFEYMGWYVVIIFVSVGILFAFQAENLFLSLILLTFLLAIGLLAIAALMMLAGIAKDLKAVRRMLGEKQDPLLQPIRHRRSAGNETTKEKGLL